jgi:tRNA pseudouridine55 synthase
MSIAKSVEVSGVLNLNKPGGMTSRDVVDLIARPLKKKAKVGHAGTLDPLASGVLVVCLGSATRLIEYVQRMGKGYRTVVRLGATSDTLDADGRIESRENPPIPTETEILDVLARQVGTIDQIPPQYSALKVQGKRAYDLARSGQTVALASRPVRIDRVELISYAWPLLELEVDCGSGTPSAAAAWSRSWSGPELAASP